MRELLECYLETMFAPRLCETENSLTLSPSFGLRAASMAAFLFFLCLTGAVLTAPFLLLFSSSRRASSWKALSLQS